MKPRFIILTAALALFPLLAVGIQSGQNLYLVTAMPTPHSSLHLPSVVWRLKNDKITPVAELTDSDHGSNFVKMDHDRRLLIIGTPNEYPQNLVVMNMDAPTSPRTVPVTVPPSGLISGFFLSNAKGLIFSVVALDDKRPNQNTLLGMDLSTGASIDLPWDSYVGLRRDGTWEPGDGSTGDFEVNVKDGKLIAHHGGSSDIDLGILAKGLAPEPEFFSMMINTDAMLVLDRISVRGYRPPLPQGRTQLEIYDRSTQKWNTEFFKGGGTSYRAFNEWLFVNEADVKRKFDQPVDRASDDRQSIGGEKRQRVLNPKARMDNQVTIDEAFKDNSRVFDGSVELLNIRTGKHYTLNTGQGDTEVLLIDGTTVYYRVNDSLYRAQMGPGTLQGATEILRDENIQLAHWAFLGR
jgi:hypothetical protein